MLLHMVFKVAKAHEPAIIFMGEADQMLYKKIPKEIAETEPKRLKKDWPKIMKKFPKENRIVVIGTATEPFAADQKSLNKLWDKIMLMPRPDYGARIELWKYALEQYTDMKYQENSPENTVDIHSLSRITEGFTSGHILAVVKSTQQKLAPFLNDRKLRNHDFLESISRIEPISEDTAEEYDKFMKKTPLAKKFAAIHAPEE